jgi:hypothetical protein
MGTNQTDGDGKGASFRPTAKKFSMHGVISYFLFLAVQLVKASGKLPLLGQHA